MIVGGLDYDSDSFKKKRHSTQVEYIRLDSAIRAEIALIYHLMTTPRRVGTADSDINAIRYETVRKIIAKHGVDMRNELQELGWSI